MLANAAIYMRVWQFTETRRVIVNQQTPEIRRLDQPGWHSSHSDSRFIHMDRIVNLAVASPRLLALE